MEAEKIDEKKIFDPNNNANEALQRTLATIDRLGLNENLMELETLGYTTVKGVLNADKIERTKRAILDRAEKTSGKKIDLDTATEKDFEGMTYLHYMLYDDVIFEEVMMKYHYNIDRDMAFVNAPEGAQDCNDYTIGWGVRNRLGDPEVKARAEAVVAQLLPGRDFSEFFASFPEPQALAQNVGWCASQVLDSTQAKLYSKGARPSDPQPVPEYHTRRPYRVMR